ncbi:MAG TPA: RluA family pseudouridine synthase [Patescibacteria group bacterium]|nr:RluA family pseudouridine synthase [Patescibacteria group bacterium]
MEQTLSVIFEDDSLLVINKPAGITVNRSETTTHQQTLQDLVEKYLHLTPAAQVISSQDDEDTEEDDNAFGERSGVVHRLDKETSGILLVAKTKQAFAVLQAEFKNREVSKTYLALAHGRVVPESGEINVPVGRLPWNRRQFGVVAGGRESLTKYQVKGYFRLNDKRKEVLTYVELHPLTGRTHQIRVHLQYLGHPIFADFLYAGRKTQREDRKYLGRVFLHAASIMFKHPETKEAMTFTASLPKELESVFDHLVPIV